MQLFSHFGAKAALAASMFVLLQSCGGGGGSSSTSFSGTAAVGSPISGGTVEFQCAEGQPDSVTTAADGTWKTSGDDITLPCLIEVSGGTVEGLAQSNKLYSLATDSGVNNVTTLTTLLTSFLGGKDAESWYLQLKSNSTKLDNIDAGTRSDALKKLAAFLKTLPTPVELPANFDPVKTEFVATPSNQFDALLEKLAANKIPLADIISEAIEKTPTSLSLESLAGFGGDMLGEILQDTHEIPAYDPLTKRLFVVNGSGAGTVEVWDIANPSQPKQVGTIATSSFGANLGGVNSVAISNGVAALAIQANPKTDNGIVAFVKTSDLSTIGTVAVGVLPDMITFAPNGRHVLTANEGEPSGYGGSYVDPEGSVSIIDIANIKKPVAKTAGFQSFNTQIGDLRNKGVRIYGPNATVAQDLEPEYVTVSADSKTAYVTLQENNAIAVVDIATAKVTEIRALGYKDHNIAGFGIDASNEDAGTNTNSGSAKINIIPVPVKGMFLPDAIANYTVGATQYLVTANEGDARADWPGFNEETRVREYCGPTGTNTLDPSVFTTVDPSLALFDSNLGRLRITTTPNGGSTSKNGSGQCNELYSFGTRSFSIWNAATGALVFDSGDGFEKKIAELAGQPGFDFFFNDGHDSEGLDSRSPNKGPEPEAVVVQRFGKKVYAFIGLERVGGVMVYDVTNPNAASYVTYINTRTKNGTVKDNANGDDGIINGGDRGPEGMVVIPAAKSPNGKPLLVVSNEISGTTRLFEIKLTY